MSRPFNGDFDVLPFVAGLTFGPVPKYPTSVQFQATTLDVHNADPFTVEGAAHHWHVEAVRERCQEPGCAFDPERLRVIASRTAKRLYKAQKERLTPT